MAEQQKTQSKKSILITGGTGLIGRALVKELQKKYDVHVVSRSKEKTIPGAQTITWEELPKYTENSFAIINLAGANIGRRWNLEYKKKILDSRVNAGKKIVNAITQAKNKPQVLIQASAIGAYGNTNGSIATESEEYGEDFLAQVCKAWEESTKDVEEMGVRRVIIRTANVLSSKGGMLEKLRPVFRAGLGGKLGSGKQYWPWIHLTDEVKAIRFLLENNKAQGTYNLVAGNVTNKQFTKTYARANKRKAWFPVPAFILKTVLGEFANALLTSTQASNKKIVEEEYKFQYTNLQEAFHNTENAKELVEKKK